MFSMICKITLAVVLASSLFWQDKVSALPEGTVGSDSQCDQLGLLDGCEVEGMSLIQVGAKRLEGAVVAAASNKADAERSSLLSDIRANLQAAPTSACNWYNPFECVWDGIKEAGEAVGAAALKAIGVIPDQKPAPLGGASVTVVNLVFGGAVAGMLLFVGLGKLVDMRWPNPFGKGHPPAWVIAWIMASYSLLVPGIVCILFSFNIWASFTILSSVHVRYNLTQKDHEPAPISESMLGFIHTLWNSGGRIGAILVIIYAMVIPGLKIFLLILGEWWRNSIDERRVLWARRCIATVQVVSKWASPDMFAYILMLYLFRNMDHPPTLLVTADLEIGFISFVVFCLNSTFASLAITLPEPAQSQLSNGDPSSRELDSLPCCVRWMGRGGVKCFALLLAAAFFVGFGIGIFQPCMAVRLDLKEMKIPESVKQILVKADFQKLVHANVSLVRCLVATASWLLQGEIAVILGFMLIGVFVMALTCLDVLMLLITAFTYRPVYTLARTPRKFDEPKIAKANQHWGMSISHYLNHIAMLDVFVMGVVVICCAGASYGSQGVEILLDVGMYPLIGAEVAHYCLYFLVSSLCSEDE